MRGMNRKKKTAAESISQFKIDFSFKREVFFIIAGALVGALTYIIPITVFAIEEGSPYYLTWIVFGHIAGVHSPISSIIVAGFMLSDNHRYNIRVISIQDQYPKYKQTIEWIKVRSLCRLFSIRHLCYTSSGICIASRICTYYQ